MALCNVFVNEQLVGEELTREMAYAYVRKAVAQGMTWRVEGEDSSAKYSIPYFLPGDDVGHIELDLSSPNLLRTLVLNLLAVESTVRTNEQLPYFFEEVYLGNKLVHLLSTLEPWESTAVVTNAPLTQYKNIIKAFAPEVLFRQGRNRWYLVVL